MVLSHEQVAHNDLDQVFDLTLVLKVSAQMILTDFLLEELHTGQDQDRMFY